MPHRKWYLQSTCSHSNLLRCLVWKKHGYRFLPTIGETHSLPYTLVTFAVPYILQNILALLECLPFIPFPKAVKPAQDAAMLGSRGNWFWGQLTLRGCPISPPQPSDSSPQCFVCVLFIWDVNLHKGAWGTLRAFCSPWMSRDGA